MTATENNSKKQGFLQRTGFSLRRGRGWQQIQDYQVGDIQSDKPVLIAAGAAVAGNVLAPKVAVAGLVYGAVVAKEVTIESGGQIWGDLYAVEVDLAADGKLHGWLNSVSERTFESLQSGDLSWQQLATDARAILPEPLQDERFDQAVAAAREKTADGDAYVALLRQLQAEVAAALLARVELETAFENRVSEIAGESISEARRLRTEVEAAREEMDEARQKLDEFQETVQLRDDQVRVQADELVTVRHLLEERDTALETLQTTFERQNLQLNELKNAKGNLEALLQNETDRADNAESRVENLESALQGSLQHTAEQEEALIRWQELAEVTEARANDLQAELDAANMQLGESSRVVDMLRGQREKLQTEWDATREEFDRATLEQQRLESELAESTAELERTTAEYESVQKEYAALKAEVAARPKEFEETLVRLAESEEKLAVLQAQLNEAQAEAQDNYEQMLWTKASLDTASSELDETRQLLVEKEASITQMQEAMRDRDALIDKWQGSVGHMTNLLFEAEQRIRELEAEVGDGEGKVDSAELAAARESLRQLELQLGAYEEEVEHYHTELDRQSARLAEMQSTLIEREIEMNRWRQRAVKQAQQAEQIKKLAGVRIQKLEAELGQTKQQLKDLSVWLERRRRRGDDVSS